MGDDTIDLTDPEEFMDNLESLFGWYVETVDALQNVELSLRQKSQVAGMVLGVAYQIERITDRLKQWGYLK